MFCLLHFHNTTFLNVDSANVVLDDPPEQYREIRIFILPEIRYSEVYKRLFLNKDRVNKEERKPKILYFKRNDQGCKIFVEILLTVNQFIAVIFILFHEI